MEGQFEALVRQRIADSLASRVPPHTRREIRLPAVIGVRRSGKATFTSALGRRPMGDEWELSISRRARNNLGPVLKRFIMRMLSVARS